MHCPVVVRDTKYFLLFVSTCIINSVLWLCESCVHERPLLCSPRRGTKLAEEEGGGGVGFVCLFLFGCRDGSGETWWDRRGLSSFSLDPPLSNSASAMAVGVPL
jgi:hypothetical protein